MTTIREKVNAQKRLIESLKFSIDVAEAEIARLQKECLHMFFSEKQTGTRFVDAGIMGDYTYKVFTITCDTCDKRIGKSER